MQRAGRRVCHLSKVSCKGTGRRRADRGKERDKHPSRPFRRKAKASDDFKQGKSKQSGIRLRNGVTGVTAKQTGVVFVTLVTPNQNKEPHKNESAASVWDDHSGCRFVILNTTPISSKERTDAYDCINVNPKERFFEFFRTFC